MTYLYQFTVDEQRIVLAAHQRFQQALSFVAELHQIRGNLVLADDMTGFLALPEAPPVPQRVNGGLGPEELK